MSVPALSVLLTGRFTDACNTMILQALSVLQSVAIHLAVNHGLGQHEDTLKSSEYNSYSKVSHFRLDCLEVRVSSPKAHSSHIGNLCNANLASGNLLSREAVPTICVHSSHTFCTGTDDPQTSSWIHKPVGYRNGHRLLRTMPSATTLEHVFW